MAEVKVVINDVKSAKSYQKVAELDDFVGKKLGDKVDGRSIGLESYELEISGGSDNAGFPMRRDIAGSARKKGLFTGGVGVSVKKDGNKIRKSVRGNVISDETAQINLKVLKFGKKSVEECLGIKKEESKQPEKKEGTPKESKVAKEEKQPEKKEEPKKEAVQEKPAAKKEEKPKEEKKE